MKILIKSKIIDYKMIKVLKNKYNVTFDEMNKDIDLIINNNVVEYAKYEGYHVDCTNWLESTTLTLPQIIDMLTEPLEQLNSIYF